MKKNYVDLGGYEFSKNDVPPARSKLRYAINEVLGEVWRKGIVYFEWDDGPSSCVLHWLKKLEHGYGYFKITLVNGHSAIAVAYEQLNLFKLDEIYEWTPKDVMLPIQNPMQPKIHFRSGQSVQLLVDVHGFKQGAKGEVVATSNRGEYVDVHFKRQGATITAAQAQLQLVK